MCVALSWGKKKKFRQLNVWKNPEFFHEELKESDNSLSVVKLRNDSQWGLSERTSQSRGRPHFLFECRRNASLNASAAAVFYVSLVSLKLPGVYPSYDLMGYKTAIMLITTRSIFLYWPSNVIAMQSHYSKLYVICDDIFPLPLNKIYCKR